MKKSNFVALILGTIGIVLFALGMVITLTGEFGTMNQGIILGVAGLIVLLADLIIWRRMEGKAPIKITGKTLGTVALAILGALLFGIGMCLTMVFGKMMLGIVIGLLGIVLLLMLNPLTRGLK